MVMSAGCIDWVWWACHGWGVYSSRVIISGLSRSWRFLWDLAAFLSSSKVCCFRRYVSSLIQIIIFQIIGSTCWITLRRNRWLVAIGAWWLRATSERLMLLLNRIRAWYLRWIHSWWWIIVSRRRWFRCSSCRFRRNLATFLPISSIGRLWRLPLNLHRLNPFQSTELLLDLNILLSQLINLFPQFGVLIPKLVWNDHFLILHLFELS